MRRLPNTLLRAIWLLLLLAGAAQAVAAAVPAAPTATPGKPGAEAVATGDIALRADVDERFVQEVMARTKRQDPAGKLSQSLDRLSDGVMRLSARFKADELRSLSALHLESLDRHWKFYGKQLELWRRDLQRAMSVYSNDAAELASRRATWEATRAAAGASAVAPALSERIAAVLAEISEAELAVSGPLDAQVRLSRRANTLDSGIAAGQRGVAAAIAYNDQRLRMIDSPMLSEVSRDPRMSKEPTLSTINGIIAERDFLDEYTAANHDRLVVHAIFAALLLPLLLWLSKRSRKIVADDPELQSSAKALLRPVSSWLVLVLVSTLLIEPDAPLLVHQIALLAALVPVLRLLPKSVFDLLGRWPYIVTVLYLFHRLGFFLAPNPLLYRMHLLVITAASLVVVVWMLLARRSRRSGIEPTARLAAIRGMGWLSAAGLGVAIVANILGNVSLAEALTAAILDTAYVGLALYAGAAVLIAVIKVLLARKTSSRFRLVTRHTGPLLKGADKLIRLAAMVLWVIVALSEFRIFSPIADASRVVLGYELKAGKLSITLGGVLLFGFSIWISFWVAKTVRVLLQDEILPRMALPRGVDNSISTLTYYALITIGVFVALAASGFEISQLTLVVGALGVGIGFGLQNVVNNFVSGLILMFERPIQPGDVIEVSGTSGKVRDIGMRATTLTTFEGADVVVPNGTLLAEKLVNWTLSDMTRRIDVNVGVAYGSNPRQVLELLMEVTRATPGIAAVPEPTVLFIGFGASSLDFAIRGWTHEFGEWVMIRSSLGVRVYEALVTAGIGIPFPQHDLHLRSIDPKAQAGFAATLSPVKPAG